MLNLLRHEMSVRRGAIIGWSLGLAFFAASYMAFYPALPPEMLELNFQDIELYRAFGNMEMATFEGYMASSVFGFLALLLGIFAVANGTGTLAGEEDNGTLEPLLALPLARWQIVVIKALAMALSALIILAFAGLVVVAAFAAIEDQINATVTAADLFGAAVSYWPVTLVFMMLSLFLGAYLPNRRTATAVAAVALVGSYFGNNLATMFESLQPVRRLLPFYYVDGSARALVEGADVGDMLVLVAAAVLLLLLAILSFQRRNVTVSAWPWQRPQQATGVNHTS